MNKSSYKNVNKYLDDINDLSKIVNNTIYEDTNIIKYLNKFYINIIILL